MVKITHRVRYPPFDPSNLTPGKLPVVENQFEIDGPVIPPFRLGNENTWLVERVIDGDYEVDTNYHGETPQIIEKQRTGWYLLPHPIHAKARNFINYVVVILLFCLFYLFTTPIQSSLGLPTFGTGKIRLGLLDYPILAVIVVPLMVTPIILRVGANLGDLRRQKEFLATAPPSPNVRIMKTRSGVNLKGKIEFPELLEEWTALKLHCRVGILPPARHKVFQALGKDPNGQPPPGLTTPLPHHWEKGLDDGTGMGEDAPMQRHGVPGGVFLRPMRIMSSSKSVSVDLGGGEFEIETPAGDWPGTLYGDLVRVHWELIASIERKKGGNLLWVEPLTIEHNKEATITDKIFIFDGRTENDTR